MKKVKIRTFLRLTKFFISNPKVIAPELFSASNKSGHHLYDKALFSQIPIRQE